MKKFRRFCSFLILMCGLGCAFTSSAEDATFTGPSPDYTYKVIGSLGQYTIPTDNNKMTYNEEKNSFDFVLPTQIDVTNDDGDTESVPAAGTVFFYILEQHSDNTSLYYGSPTSGPSLLSGSNTYGLDTDITQVQSFYFTALPGKKYTIRLIGEYVTLITEDAAPFYLEAGSINGYSQSVFSPRTGDLINFTENSVITSVRVSVWDVFALEQPTSRYIINDSQERSIDAFRQLFESQYDNNDGNIWMLDNLSNGEGTTSNKGYSTGEYMYKLDVAVKDGNHRTTYTSYSNPFTIINANDTEVPRNDLILKGFYLVHDYTSEGQASEEGSTEDSLNGIYYSCDVDENEPTYLITDSNASQGHSGVLTFDKQPNDTKIDFGNEDNFRFTDCVLLRTTAPDRIKFPSNKIVSYRVYESDTAEGEGTLIATNDSKYENQDVYNINLRQSDDRLMVLLPDRLLEPRFYWVKMDYRNENEGLETVTSNKCEVGLTLPSPKIQNIYTVFFKGASENKATDSAAAKTDFVFKGFTLSNARFHNLRQTANITAPNVTEKLGPKMQVSDGRSFSYDFKFVKDGAEEFVNPRVVDWEATTPLMKATYLMPGQFDEGSIRYTSSYTRPVYNRWGEKTLSHIDINLDAPANFNEEETQVEVINSELSYNRADELIEKFQISAKMEAGNTNYISYRDKNGETQTEALMHGGGGQNSNDYYYLTIVDTDKPIEGEIDEFEIVDVIDSQGNSGKAEFVFNRRQLEYGQNFRFMINHGKWYDGQLDKIRNHHLFAHLEVRVRYLYPFNLTNENLASSSSTTPGTDTEDSESDTQQAPRRKGGIYVSGNENGEVLASDPAIFIFNADEIVTSVQEIGNELSSLVKAGKGFVDIFDESVEVYDLTGVKVAKGAGRHALNAGLYIVKTHTNNSKIFVL